MSATETIWKFPGCPEPPEWKLDMPALAARFPWLAALAECMQDETWHAEGDVLTHTGMVMDQLVASAEWRALPEAQRNIVFAGTLLHDVAKPAKTRQEEGHVRSRGHARLGAQMARQIFQTTPELTGVPLKAREQVVALVRHHGLPGYFWERADPVRAVITASVMVAPELLCILAGADARGRICKGTDDATERVELFRAFCQENGCLTAPYPFHSDQARFRYFHREDMPPTAQIYDATRCTVTMMCGLPAAGKDTWVRTNAGEQPVISLDALRGEMDIDPGDGQGAVIDAAKKQAMVYLRERRSFIWNATNTTRFLRDGLVALFAAYEARVVMAYCEAPWATVLERNARRAKPVPGAVMTKLFEHLEVPDLTEAHEVMMIQTR